jgi:thioredoxin-dependent peroxiredoxin
MSKKSRENSSRPAAKSALRKTAAAASVKGTGKVPKKPAAKSSAVAKAKTKKAVKKTVQPAAKAAAKPAGKRPKPAAAAKPVTAVFPRVAPAKTAPKPKSAATPAPKLAVEGAKAPPFSLPRDGGGHVSLADYAGQKLVIFFYPRANTPGCTKEAIDFSRLSHDFAAAGTAVLGVSADPLKAQESFRNKHDLTMPLMSDETHDMLEAYGAWGEKSMYGKAFQGVFRTTILIGKDGQVAQIWRNVKVDGHADAVLEAARGI